MENGIYLSLNHVLTLQNHRTIFASQRVFEAGNSNGYYLQICYDAGIKKSNIDCCGLRHVAGLLRFRITHF